MSRYLLRDLKQLSNENYTVDCEYMLDMLRLCFIVFASSLAVCSCEKGSCPPTLSVDVCDATCGLSHPCNTTQICCPTACGGSMCVDPMTQRHFVTLEKPGECPEYPRGVWICSHTCTGDSDCPRTLKCCANRCGALTCQRPENLPQPS